MIFEKYCRFKTPIHDDYEDLERKYWRNVLFNPPMYGADISGSITDGDQDVWNINRLGTLLDCVNKDYGIKIEGISSLCFFMHKISISTSKMSATGFILDQKLNTINKFFFFKWSRIDYLFRCQHGIFVLWNVENYISLAYRRYGFVQYKLCTLWGRQTLVCYSTRTWQTIWKAGF